MYWHWIRLYLSTLWKWKNKINHGEKLQAYVQKNMSPEHSCWLHPDTPDLHDYEWGHKSLCNDEVININKEENSRKQLEEMNW